ncbi:MULTISPECIES: thiol-disulfide oxidoreductase ResA [Thalassobacillus]|uniref:thiol-disulfide oxidoreductase ResA n=1 Tax=Thalassobacillus TaxID=331971 RepID=UPI000A1C88C7|nr:thiol-disulfide oxidoreductase ResA [Thalassobacillus devorans]
MDKKKKKQRRMIFRTLTLAVLVGLVIFAIIGNLSQDDAVVAEGEQAPNFELEQFGTEGERKSLDDFKGKGVMLNFWATYCKPCEEEMPYMQELYPKYKEKGVEIVGVNLDSTKLVVNRFIDKYELTFTNLHDKNGQVMDQYGISPIPSTFFIDENGEIVDKVIGPLTLEKLEEHLKEIQPEA